MLPECSLKPGQVAVSHAEGAAVPSGAANSSRRPRGLRGLVGLALAAGTLASALQFEPEPVDHRPAAAGTVTLSDDDQGSAMFDVSGLGAGDSVSRCLRVTYAGAPPSAVTLHGASGGTGLAEHLLMTVEEGTGGGFGSCAGFSGTRVFEGTLASFAQAHPSDGVGVATSMGAAGGDERTFRIELTLANAPAAQGRGAIAEFTWAARAQAGSPPPGPSPPARPDRDPPPRPDRDSPPRLDLDPPASSGPVGTPSAPPDAAPGSRGVPSALADTAPAGTERPSRDSSGRTTDGDERAVPRAGSGRGDGSTERPGHDADGGGGILNKLAKLGQAVLPAAERAAFPIFLLLIVAVFLALQDRIDRRDPKLALAPVDDEPYIAFTPEGTGGREC